MSEAIKRGEQLRQIMQDSLNHKTFGELKAENTRQRALIETLVKALERIASVCSDRSEKTGWRIDSISDEADAALAAAKEITQ